MKDLIKLMEWLNQFENLSVKPNYEDFKMKVESLLPIKYISTHKAQEIFLKILKEEKLLHKRYSRKKDVILIKQSFVKVLCDMGYKQKEIIDIFNYKDRSIISYNVANIEGLLQVNDEKTKCYYKKVLNLVNE